MVNFGYPYNDLVICKDSTDYLERHLLINFANLFLRLTIRGIWLDKAVMRSQCVHGFRCHIDLMVLVPSGVLLKFAFMFPVPSGVYANLH